MKKLDILPGDRFNHWTVLSELENSKSGDAVYLCRCDCGREAKVKASNLLNGRSKSCGHCQPPVSNTSGRRGVHWNRKDQKWEANITHNGQRKYLGQYDEKEDAVSAREAAEREISGK